MNIVSIVFSVVFLAELGWICWYLWKNDRNNQRMLEVKHAAETEAVVAATVAAKNASEAAKVATEVLSTGMQVSQKTSESINQIAKILAEHEATRIIKP